MIFLRDQKRFKAVNLEKVDVNSTAFLYLHTANVWMGVRLVSQAAHIFEMFYSNIIMT